MPDFHDIGIVAAAALVTIALRFLPFWVFSGSRETPPYILYLGKVLPYAIMGMLVIFCLKNTTLTTAPYAIPEAAASLLVILLHIWKRNTLLSILGGTACYMALVQLVF